jgi:hypothetical protein
LLSTNKALKNSYDLRNKGLSICLSKGSFSINFDRVMRTTNGSVSGIKLIVNESPVVCNTLSSTYYGKNLDINEFHKILLQCGSDRLEKTSKIHDLKLIGEFKTCEQCAIAKARQKNVNKNWKDGIQFPGEKGQDQFQEQDVHSIESYEDFWD